jgi:primosomal protein N' (replication factor Y)
MVTKGLDFAGVSLVGVIDADQMIHFPDFRAHERAFQMLSQVSGRAGRKAERGTVLIQTAEPQHPVLQKVIAHDYEAFYAEEIEERKNFSYPPFTRMVAVRVKAKEKLLSKHAIREIYQQCRLHLPEQVQIKQPHEPLVSKIRNQYIQEMMLFVDRNMPQKGWKSRLQKVVAQVKAQKPYQKIRIILDVDPV